ncbi:Host cell factor [Diplodia seriata]|uniref:Host cell factor n=1 Tax=Diplodia seriata TaxID=420778 RepID=A0A1S8BDV1_9PEZI|nr:Host cell factor [Diplodia seriata]
MGNTTEFLGGMIVLNTVDTSSKNLSTATLGDPRVAGGLQFIDAIGSNGALIAIGGLQRNENQTEVITFDHVHLCDDFTANSTWYRQSATGDIPPPRSDFCIVAASAPDNSSHNIYLYGGIDPTNTTTGPILYDDIYILSLPSFTWTRVFGGESPRWGHTCHLVGNRQMLTVGGTIDAFVYDVETQTQTTINASALTCDWETKGVAVLDMSTMKWGSVFDAYAAAYRVPDAVVGAIGGGAEGGATATAPAGGFDETVVAAMFSPRVAATPPSGDSGAADTDSGDAGTVAGAVVGGLVAVGLLLGICLCILRKKKRAREKAREEEDRNRNTEGYQGMGYPEFPDASRYELNGQGHVPEMTGGALAHELHATEEPMELASSHRPFELSTDLSR